MAGVYNLFKQKIADGTIDWDAAVVRIMLVTSGYTFNADHQFVSDLTPGTNELSGPGYSRQTVGTRVVNLDQANDRAELGGADVTWAGINAGTAAAAVLYVQVGGDDTTPGDDILIAYVNTGGFPIATNGGNLTITWNAEGIIQLS